MTIPLKSLFFVLGACIVSHLPDTGNKQAFAEGMPEFSCPGSYFSTPLTKKDRLLPDVQASYEKVESLAADFTQRSYLAALEMSEQSQGSVTYSKPGKMRWEYGAPEKQLFLVDKTKLWFYQPEEKQLIIDDFASILITDIPIAFLLGIGDLSQQFQVNSACKGTEATVLHLQPKEKSNGKRSEKLQDFVLIVSNDGFIPMGAEVIDVAGNRTAVWFDKLAVNKAVASETFEPTFPKGIDVIDRS